MILAISLLIVEPFGKGAGGAFGAVIAATDVGIYLGQNLSGLGIGVLMPFLVAAR